MRAGLSTIQQTLTPEAASVLNHAIAESGRRDHVQTTPLHVAAALLSSPTGFLRQACIKSHPNSSHPLQCRALELCFSVALERLPTSQNMSSATEPPISNALMAALKRAQAHQRRGCPEQQQQPLLAVKVQLEQLIISILDDPSVSRVMREASFSSPAVKATIEQSLNSSPPASKPSPLALNFRPTNGLQAPVNRNLYMNPRFQQAEAAQSGQQRGDEIKKVVDVLLRTKKKNPILVGESEPEAVTKELLRMIENKEMGEGPLQNIQVIHLEKEIFSDKIQIPTKVKELESLVETQMADVNGGRGVILNLGDLNWLAEQPGNFPIYGSGREEGRLAVAEIGKLLARLGEIITRRLWLIGTATCETYLRCQVYHPSMENDWDLQALPMVAKAPLPVLFPRLGTTGIVSSSVECLSSMKGFPAAAVNSARISSENSDSVPKTSCCPPCRRNYEEELAKLVAMEAEQSSEVKHEPARPPLPQWLRDAKTNDKSRVASPDPILKKKNRELEKKWNDMCYHLHPNFHHSNNLELLRLKWFQPELRPGNPVRVDLVLEETNTDPVSSEKTHKERTKNFLTCISSPEPERNSIEMQSNKLFSELDADSYKKLLKGLMEKVWWQQEAASAIATTVTQCKLGNSRRQTAGSKGDMWLFFIGLDRVGKKKMVLALSELVSGSNPLIITLGSRWNDGESNVNFRGKTVLDRISEAVRRNPFSVIMIEDIDEADILTRGSIKSAMERGRIIDSHGREISLGNVIFVLSSNWLPDNLKYLSNGISLDEEKLARLAKGNWQLRLSLYEKTTKRKPDWLNNVNPSRKPRKETIGFDLNEAAGGEDDFGDGSHNSSDLTIEHDDDHSLGYQTFSTSRELINIVDNSIVFKPVDFELIKHHITTSIVKQFSTIVGDKMTMEIQEEALEKILSGVWLGTTRVEEWTDKVLIPSFQELVNCLPDKSTVAKLELDGETGSRGLENLLPSAIKVMINK